MKSMKKVAVLLVLVVAFFLFKGQVAQAIPPQGLRCHDISGCGGAWGCTGPGLEVVRCGLCCDGDGVAEVICLFPQ